MLHRAVAPLRVLLALLFAVMVLAQVLLLLELPGMVRRPLEDPPEFTYFLWTVLIVSVLGLACVQVVIVSTWKLLTMVRHDRIFSTSSRPWVDAIVRAIGGLWLMLLAALFPAYAYAEVDDAPGLILMVLLALLAVTALGLLMVVMRALLLQATTLRSDMEAVI